MSIEITNETKSIEILTKERTWRIEILTERDSTYLINIYREIDKTVDGNKLPVDRKNVEIPKLTQTVPEVLSSEEILSYTDLNGDIQTIPIKHFPILISAYCDKAITDKKSEIGE